MLLICGHPCLVVGYRAFLQYPRFKNYGTEIQLDAFPSHRNFGHVSWFL